MASTAHRHHHRAERAGAAEIGVNLIALACVFAAV
jgi:hypothetical protein